MSELIKRKSEAAAILAPAPAPAPARGDSRPQPATIAAGIHSQDPAAKNVEMPMGRPSKGGVHIFKIPQQTMLRKPEEVPSTWLWKTAGGVAKSRRAHGGWRSLGEPNSTEGEGSKAGAGVV